jgi:hypothetical protein
MVTDVPAAIIDRFISFPSIRDAPFVPARVAPLRRCLHGSGCELEKE